MDMQAHTCRPIYQYRWKTGGIHTCANPLALDTADISAAHAWGMELKASQIVEFFAERHSPLKQAAALAATQQGRVDSARRPDTARPVRHAHFPINFFTDGGHKTDDTESDDAESLSRIFARSMFKI